MSDKPEVELTFTAYGKNILNVKYLENQMRYDKLNRGQIGNQQWSVDWHYEL